jgi:hypothetical protein
MFKGWTGPVEYDVDDWLVDIDVEQARGHEVAAGFGGKRSAGQEGAQQVQVSSKLSSSTCSKGYTETSCPNLFAGTTR